MLKARESDGVLFLGSTMPKIVLRGLARWMQHKLSDDVPLFIGDHIHLFIVDLYMSSVFLFRLV